MRHRSTRFSLLLLATLTLSLSGVPQAGAAAPSTWFRQFGSGENDVANQVEVDGAGNVYAAARLWASLIVTSYSPDGDVRWTTDVGLGGVESLITGFAVDAEGRSYATGYADSSPGFQYFVQAFNVDGSKTWNLIYASDDELSPWSVDVNDAGEIFVGGFLSPSVGGEDVYLAKYDATGAEMWMERFSVGEAANVSDLTVAGDGSAFLSGQSFGAQANEFVARVDPGGTLEWIESFPQASLHIWSLAGEALGHLYMVGHATETLSGQVSAGSGDAFVRKLDSGGGIVWTRQFGTAGFDHARSVALDQAGNVYVAGRVHGLLAGPAQITSRDPFVRAYNPDGDVLWTRQFAWGLYGSASPEAMSASDDGMLVFAGSAVVPEPDITAQVTDAFVMRGVQPALPALPSPSTVYELDTSLEVSWPAESDAGSQVGGYHVDVHGAAYRGSWWDYTRWKDVDETITSGSYSAVPGGTYCFRARSLDAGGGLMSVWTPDELCRAVPLDDVQLTASPSWKRFHRDDYYLGTYSRSSSKGATLRKYDVVAKRIGLVATRCPGCGAVDVLWNGALLRRIDLNHPTVARQALFLVKLFSSARVGDITIKVVSSGKPVYIDGLGLSRASGP